MKAMTHMCARPKAKSVYIIVGAALAATILGACAVAQAQQGDTKPAESKSDAGTAQTFFLTHITQSNDANDLQTDLRNVLPKARMFYVASQNAITIQATPEDMMTAQKLIAELDRTRKTYRLTYTITEMDSGKSIGKHNLSLIVLSGSKTVLKQGSRVPIVTGTAESSPQSSQVQYVDVGLNIEAFVDGTGLRTKVEQTSVAEEKSSVGIQDPVIHQTTLEGMATLAQGKPLVLGSIDIPGTTRKQEIEVVSELVQ